MTCKKLVEKRKSETNQYNLKTFSNLSIGIHGNELPKFTENMHEYWKLKANHVETPKSSTRTELLGSRRGMELASPVVRECSSAVDEGKVSLKKQLSCGEITDKPGHPSHLEEYTPIDGYKTVKIIPAKHEYRLSTVFGYFLKSKTAEHNSGETRVVQTREKTRGEPKILSVVEHCSPGTTTTVSNKTKTLVKKQGTSARLLRSRGFIG